MLSIFLSIVGAVRTSVKTLRFGSSQILEEGPLEASRLLTPDRWGANGDKR